MVPSAVAVDSVIFAVRPCVPKRLTLGALQDSQNEHLYQMLTDVPIDQVLLQVQYSRMLHLWFLVGIKISKTFLTSSSM